MRKRGIILVLLLKCSLLVNSQSFNFSNDFNRGKLPPVHYKQYIRSSELSSSSLTHNSASSAPVCKEIDWAVWDSFKENSAIGTINSKGSNVSIILNASFGVESTAQIERYDVFKRYKTPVLNTAVPRTSWSKQAGGKITICFSQTVKEPVLLLASLGSYKDRIRTTISFSEPYVMLYNGGGMLFDNNNTVTGREGYAIIKFPGDIKCITIHSSSYENFTDFTWGIPVCPDGTPKPASDVRNVPEAIPLLAENVKPAQPAVVTPAPVPKPALVPNPEPVVPKVKPKPLPEVVAAVPAVLPKPPVIAKPAKPEIVTPPIPAPAVPKPIVVVPKVEAKPNPVVAAVPSAVPKPVPVAPPIPASPAPKPIVVAPVVEAKPNPVVASTPIAVPKPVPSKPLESENAVVAPVKPASVVKSAPLRSRPAEAAKPAAKPVLQVVSKPSPAILQNATASQGRFLKIEVFDFDGMDYDSVSLKLNGIPVGPKAIPLALYKRYGSAEFTYTLELSPGDNILEVFAISEGLRPYTTVGILIMYDNGRKRYEFSLKAKELTTIRL